MTNLKAFSGRLLLVGCGNMAGAMLDRWLAAGLDPAQVAVVDPYAAPRDGVALHASLADWRAADGRADWVMLGMKPQQLGEVAEDVAPAVGGGVHLLSILAGVPLADLAARFPEARAQVRIVPNLAARIGAGVSAMAGVGDIDRTAVEALLAPLGAVVPLPDDSTMDLVTAFTSSGPAFVFRLIEAYAAAGERLGLSAEDALTFATATFAGAAALLSDSGEKPGALIAQVASKGGTTQAGLDVLDSDGQLAALLTNVLRAARDRGRELADIARGEE
jgi:pyrroline-5-carboxylate reductase